MKHRKKLISNKSFAAAWEAASKASSYRELCSMAYESKYFNPLYLEKNSGISLEDFYIVIEKIYKAYNMTFEEIMNKAQTTNSKLRDCFCIPEKSIEAWKSGRNKCPDYIRLMLLRYYHLINLGKYIYTEEYDNFLSTIPKVYEDTGKRKSDNKAGKTSANKGIPIKSSKRNDNRYIEEKNDSEKAIYEAEKRDDLEKVLYDTEEEDFDKLINSLPSYEKLADLLNESRVYSKKSSIVNKTDYLDDILKKRKS